MVSFQNAKAPDEFACFEQMMNSLLNLTSENFNNTVETLKNFLDNRKICPEYFPIYISYVLEIRPNITKLLIDLYSILSKNYEFKATIDTTKYNLSGQKSTYLEGTACHCCEIDDIAKLTDIASNPFFDFNMADDNSINIIDIAAQNGSINCFKFLKQKGANFTKATLTNALKSGNTEIIKVLIDNGQTISLEKAIRYHYHDAAAKLLEGKEDALFDSYWAVESFNFKAVSFLCENDLDVNELEILY